MFGGSCAAMTARPASLPPLGPTAVVIADSCRLVICCSRVLRALQVLLVPRRRPDGSHGCVSCSDADSVIYDVVSGVRVVGLSSRARLDHLLALLRLLWSIVVVGRVCVVRIVSVVLLDLPFEALVFFSKFECFVSIVGDTFIFNLELVLERLNITFGHPQFLKEHLRRAQPLHELVSEFKHIFRVVRLLTLGLFFDVVLAERRLRAGVWGLLGSTSHHLVDLTL